MSQSSSVRLASRKSWMTKAWPRWGGLNEPPKRVMCIGEFYLVSGTKYSRSLSGVGCEWKSSGCEDLLVLLI